MSSVLGRRIKPKKPPVEPIKRWKFVRGDVVQVISGKEKGKVAKIIKVNRKRNTVLLEGLNLVKKHIKSTEEFKGGIFTKEAPIHYSNIAHIDPETKKPTKITWMYTEDGRHVRVVKRKATRDPETGDLIPQYGPIIEKPAELTAYKEIRKQRPGGVAQTSRLTCPDNPDKDTPPHIAIKRTFVKPELDDLPEMDLD